MSPDHRNLCAHRRGSCGRGAACGKESDHALLARTDSPRKAQSQVSRWSCCAKKEPARLRSPYGKDHREQAAAGERFRQGAGSRISDLSECPECAIDSNYFLAADEPQNSDEGAN